MTHNSLKLESPIVLVRNDGLDALLLGADLDFEATITVALIGIASRNIR